MKMKKIMKRKDCRSRRKRAKGSKGLHPGAALPTWVQHISLYRKCHSHTRASAGKKTMSEKKLRKSALKNLRLLSLKSFWGTVDVRRFGVE
jgi:hypothetical protein